MPTPWQDRGLAWLVGKGLVRLGKRAYGRGDVHEYRHILAAVTSGNSEDCGKKVLCTLDQPHVRFQVRCICGPDVTGGEAPDERPDCPRHAWPY